MPILLTPHVRGVKVWPKMKKKGLAWLFVFLLAGCGGSGQTLWSDSKDTLTSTSASPSVSKSNDPQLENFVEQIHSEKYEGYLVLQLTSSGGTDILPEGLEAKPLFGTSVSMIANRVKQVERTSGKKMPDLTRFYKI